MFFLVLFVFLAMLSNLDEIHWLTQFPNFAEFLFLLLEGWKLYLVVEILFHLFVQRSPLFLQEVQPLFDSLLPDIYLRFDELNLLDHPEFLLFLHLLLLFGGFLHILMIHLVLLVEYLLPLLLEFALPLPVLVVQFLQVLLDLDGAGVVVIPVVVLPLVETHRQVDVAQHFLHLLDDLRGHLRRRRRWGRDSGFEVDFALRNAV